MTGDASSSTAQSAAVALPLGDGHVVDVNLLAELPLIQPKLIALTANPRGHYYFIEHLLTSPERRA